MPKYLLIGLGGFCGAIMRYVVSGLAQQWSNSISFPYGTLAVNVLGCLIIGFLAQLAESRGLLTAPMRFFIFIGFLGAFTTFSTFGNETLNLFQDGLFSQAILNIGLSVVLCLGAVWLGHVTANLVWR